MNTTVTLETTYIKNKVIGERDGDFFYQGKEKEIEEASKTLFFGVMPSARLVGAYCP